MRWPSLYNSVRHQRSNFQGVRCHFYDRAFLTLSIVSFLTLTCRAEKLPLKIYTTADGLAHNTVNKIVRDSRGFLWFCTEEGLSRFDGYTFTNYRTEQGLPHPSVNDLLETHAGDYWIATNGGLVHFNPRGVPNPTTLSLNESAARTQMFTVVRPDDEDRLSRVITTLFESRDGTLWCGTLKGLYRLVASDARFALIPVDLPMPSQAGEWRFVTDIVEDTYGSLWIATHGGLYRRWADGRAAHYMSRDGLPDYVIHDLLLDQRGDLWVGSRNAGLFRLSFNETEVAPVVAHYMSKDGLGSDWVFVLFESTDGNLWAGTNNGLCEVDLSATGEVVQLRSYTRSNGLSYQEIVSICADRDGNLWLATDNNGLMKLARSGFTTFAEQDGLSQVTSLFQSNAGEVYAHGYVLGNQQASVFEGAKLDLLNPNSVLHRRIGRFDGQRFDWFIPDVLRKSGSPWTDKTLVLQTRTGEWWLATAFRLYFFPQADSPATLKAARPVASYGYREDLGGGDTTVYCIYEDSRGDLWIATVASTGNGLFRWERDTRTLRDMSHTTGLPGLKDHLPAAFQEDRAGNIWIGFAQGELARFAADRFELFTADQGLTGGRINSLYLDGAGRLWSATTRGVGRIDNPDATRPLSVNYTTAQGLSGNVANAIAEDLYGRIYIGTSQGLDQFNLANGHVKHYTTADGLAGGKICAALRDQSGSIWIGTTEGLSRFTPEPERPSLPPPVLVTGLNVAGTAQNISALGESELHLADLSPSASQLQIDFVGLSFAPGGSLRYQYMLEGADSGWSPPTTRRSVTYAHLASGGYTFRVRAVNADGEVSATPALITFRMLPPIWLRWWFVTLAVLGAAAAIYLIYRYRVNRLLEVANMRTRIATDLHDDIGANLTRISILSEVAKQQFGNGEEKRANPLSSIAEIARESVTSMSDIVWAINPQRDSLHDLIRKMRQHADEVFTLRDIDLEFNAPSQKPDLKLGVDARRDLLLIFKEAVSNAARHSGCSRVLIDFKADHQHLSLRVADNGEGFDSDEESTGHGLVSMRRRADHLGGNLRIDSKPGSGTTVKVQVPLARARTRARVG